MGNTLTLPVEKDTSTVHQKDCEYLELSCSSIYNDEYVSNIYKNLPNLDGINDEELIKKKTAKKNKITDNTQQTSRIHDIMNVFSTRPESTAIETFQVHIAHL